LSQRLGSNAYRSYAHGMYRLLTLALAVLVVGPACNSLGSSRSGSCAQCESGCARVSGSEARQLVVDGAQLVDVRTPREFEDSHIEGATNIPLADLETRLAELDVQRTLVVYCRSGNRSGQASKLLCARGYTVYDLGARTAW
jgi:rhodanese-related sulfurtransferase